MQKLSFSIFGAACLIPEGHTGLQVNISKTSGEATQIAGSSNFNPENLTSLKDLSFKFRRPLSESEHDDFLRLTNAVRLHSAYAEGEVEENIRALLRTLKSEKLTASFKTGKPLQEIMNLVTQTHTAVGKVKMKLEEYTGYVDPKDLQRGTEHVTYELSSEKSNQLSWTQNTGQLHIDLNTNTLARSVFSPEGLKKREEWKPVLDALREKEPHCTLDTPYIQFEDTGTLKYWLDLTYQDSLRVELGEDFTYNGVKGRKLTLTPGVLDDIVASSVLGNLLKSQKNLDKAFPTLQWQSWAKREDVKFVKPHRDHLQHTIQIQSDGQSDKLKFVLAITKEEVVKSASTLSESAKARLVKELGQWKPKDLKTLGVDVEELKKQKGSQTIIKTEEPKTLLQKVLNLRKPRKDSAYSDAEPS